MAEDPRRQLDRAVIAPSPSRRRSSNLFQVILFLASGLFAALAIAAHQHPYFAIDLAITRAIQGDHGVAFHRLMVALSWLGFTPQVAVIGAALMAIIWFLGLRWEAVGALVAAAGVALVTVVKLVVLRPRPTADVVQVVTTISETSFPSGHVFMATAFCGYLAYLAFTLLKPSWGRTLLVALLAVVIVLMGLSRIYLGQHWFSDVLGGHVLGGLWLAVTIRAYRWGKPKYFVRQPVAPAAPPGTRAPSTTEG